MEEFNILFKHLSPSWFENLLFEFDHHPYYKATTNMLYDAREWLHQYIDPDTEDYKEELVKDEFEADFFKYAWEGLFSHFQDYPVWDEGVKKGRTIAKEVINLLTPLVEIPSNVSEKYSIILSAIKSMQEGINELKESYSNETYGKLLDYILKEIRIELNRKFGAIKKVFNTIESFEDKFIFDVNLDELAFVLQLLTEAKIISHSFAYSSEYIPFCARYFYFRNKNENNSHTRATNFFRSISAVRSKNSSRNFSRIKERLKTNLFEALRNM